MALFAAVECGDAKKVGELLAKIPQNNVNEKDYRDRTALHLAVERGHLDMVDVLLGYEGVELAAEDYGGFTALHLAAEFGHDKIVAQLLEKFPQLAERRTRKGLTCLHLAVIRGHATIVKQLLATNLELLDIVAYRGKSALEFAVGYGHEGIIAMLVNCVAQSKNVSDATAMFRHAKVMFHHAIRIGSDNVASQLLTQNPELMNIEDLGSDLHHFAAMNPLKQEDDLSFELCGKSVLHLAAEYGRDMIVGRLLADKPDLLAESPDVLDISNHLLQSAAKKEMPTMNFFQNTPFKRTGAFHLAAKNGHADVVAQLLAAKPALASQIDNEGHTALHLAAAQCNEVVPLLLTHCPVLIDVEDRRGQTPLHLAVDSYTHVLAQGSERLELVASSHSGSYRKTVACLLAQKPARVDEKTLWNALARAKDVASDEVVILLIQYKPELIRSLGDNGRTVLHRVLGFRTNTRALFSEELILLVWQMIPEALHKLDDCNETPFHTAIWSDNKFAMELIQAKSSLDEIVEAFAKCNKECPQSVLNGLRECLVGPLNKDVVELISGYLTPPPKVSGLGFDFLPYDFSYGRKQPTRNKIWGHGRR